MNCSPNLRHAIKNYISRERLAELIELGVDLDTWLEAQICNAVSRTGERCKSKRLPNSTKCALHGGKSTGPKTKEGKARALANLKQYRNK